MFGRLVESGYTKSEALFYIENYVHKMGYCDLSEEVELIEDKGDE